MPNPHQQNLCAFHMGLTADPGACRTGCAASEARKRERAALERLAPHFEQLTGTDEQTEAKLEQPWETFGHKGTIRGWGWCPVHSASAKGCPCYETKAFAELESLRAEVKDMRLTLDHIVSTVSNGQDGIDRGNVHAIVEGLQDAYDAHRAEVKRLRACLERIASSACENECDCEAEETLYPEGRPTCPTCGRDCICGEEE